MGREKTFDEKEVLFKILQIFWVKGYEKTSLKDIENETKLSKPSLYNAFGNKEEIYIKCLGIYCQLIKKKFEELPRGIHFIEHFFDLLIMEIEKKDLPNGCLVMNSAIEFSNINLLDQKITAVTEVWQMIENYFKQAIEDAKKNKEISPSVESKSLSRWLMTQLFAIRGFSKISSDVEYCKMVKDEVLKNLSKR